MSTVPNAPEGAWDPRFDLLRRREECADVFVTARSRPEVEAVALLPRRGLLDLRWVHELFTTRAGELVSGVRFLDRESLRDAYALLFVEERLIRSAVCDFPSAETRRELPLFVVDAVGDVVGALTQVERLARAWAWFLGGDSDDEG